MKKQIRLARRVAAAYTNLLDAADDDAFDPKESIDKMIGEMTTQQLGVDDAPELFFVRVRSELKEELGGKIDLEDDKMYPALNRIVIDVAKSMDLVDDK
jgi:hypothetical protein